MKNYLVLISCICFLIFLIPGRFRKYFAIGGWASIVCYLFLELPYYFSINNFMYPAMAFLSVPFLYITAKHLLRADPRVMQLSMIAAVAFLIYAPFGYIPALGDWLIAAVANQTSTVLAAIGYPVNFTAWNVMERNGFRTEIILACTGIQSIAIMLGVAWGVRSTLQQKIVGFFLVFPTIYILNILRNAFVVIAYTEQWFPYLPGIASNGEFGYESFFWAHNVMAEFGALIFLVILAYALFTILPELGNLADGLYQLYRGEVEQIIRPKTGMSDP
ncbi:MAG TPA: archaeosortase A [Candidatus Methanoculleus thermohydrogenotrophicum]|nr:archaeosortase A [Candidatus Methanoculleus thermohydrogenotrophicum]HOB17324.1 archaeosortase A [Candidatus Methanoculleus thermohydrogenotrophicum]HPZ37479.1 archaeosortase A [Candidatus Methanoculleus thermohydrogenotrophicum]HQC90931.1 archaeosortase A [Candidatus Methanoculleus thermohydrogenotrophicum]